MDCHRHTRTSLHNSKNQLFMWLLLLRLQLYYLEQQRSHLATRQLRSPRRKRRSQPSRPDSMHSARKMAIVRSYPPRRFNMQRHPLHLLCRRQIPQQSSRHLFATICRIRKSILCLTVRMHAHSLDRSPSLSLLRRNKRVPRCQDRVASVLV